MTPSDRAPTDPGPPPPTERTRLRRKAERGRHDRATIDAILDEGFVCHLGFAADGRPWVIPTAYGRAGDVVYVHGAAANHALRSIAAGVEACLTVTLLDGIVLARSAFHHSFNYRSVMIFGVAKTVDDLDEKRGAVTTIMDHVVPGRSRDARGPTDTELRATTVLALPVDEASAKVRTGGPVEEPEDLSLAVWAGEIPLHLVADDAVPDDDCDPDLAVPGYASAYGRPAAR